MNSLIRWYATALAAAPALAACGSSGPTVSVGADLVAAPPPLDATSAGGIETDVGGTKIRTWAATDAAGRIVKVSWTFPLALVDAPPSSNGDLFILVKLPEEVGRQTIFRNLMLNFFPHGHRPVGVYDVPLWAFHLFTPSDADYLGIDCADPVMPLSELLPSHWFLAPPPDNCQTKLGIRAFSADLPELNKTTFTASALIDYYHGKFVSYEPHASVDLWRARKSYELALPDMRLLGVNTLYPTHYAAEYVADGDLYIVSVDQFAGLKN